MTTSPFDILKTWRDPLPAPALPEPAPWGNTKLALKAGDKVGHWTLLSWIPGLQPSSGAHRRPGRWLCRCSCGAQRSVKANNLTSKLSLSCGHTRYERAQPLLELELRA